MLRTARFGSCVLLATLALRANLLADSVSNGFALVPAPNPAGAATTCTLPDGDFVTSDGFAVARWNADGSLDLHLWSRPTFVFASFVTPTPDGTAVIVGDSGNGVGVGGDLYSVALDGSGATFLASVPFNYDGEFAPNGDLIVSAAQGGFGADNDLVRVRFAPLSVTPIGQVAGASGPIAISRTGDVYYATQPSGFPPPLGATNVLRWSAAQLAAGTFLTEANAVVHAAGFESAGSLAFDPLKGRLYLVENNFNTGSYRILRVKNSAANSIELVVSDTWISGVRFQNLGGAATFDAYQPADGWSMVYETTDFGSFNQLVTVAPARPVLSASGAGVTGLGAFTLQVSGGVPNGTALYTYTPQTSLLPAETSYPLPRFLHHSPFVLSQTTRFDFLVPLDASGVGTLTLWNPGDLHGLFAWQVMVGGPLGNFSGSSNALSH